MLPLGGLHVKHAVQSGISITTQHLLWDQGEVEVTLRLTVNQYVLVSSILVRLATRVRVTLRLTVSQSVSMSWCRAQFVDVWPDIDSFQEFGSGICCLVSVGRPLWREAGSVLCKSQSSNLSVCTSTINIFVFHTFIIYIYIHYTYIYHIYSYILYNTHNIYKASFSPGSVQ
jgi:hypothetical protein